MSSSEPGRTPAGSGGGGGKDNGGSADGTGPWNKDKKRKFEK